MFKIPISVQSLDFSPKSPLIFFFPLINEYKFSGITSSDQNELGLKKIIDGVRWMKSLVNTQVYAIEFFYAKGGHKKCCYIYYLC